MNCLKCKTGYILLNTAICEPTPEELESCSLGTKIPRPNKGEFAYSCNTCDEGFLMLEDRKCKSIADTDYPVKLPICPSTLTAENNLFFGNFGYYPCVCKDGTNPPCAGGAIMRVMLGLLALFTTSLVVF